MKIAVNDTRLFFDVDGPLVRDGEERPTIVMLHPGPGADHSLFKDFAGPRLAEVAQVVYLDHRGEGRSDPSPVSEWTLETWAADVVAFLDALEIERPVLYGASIGSLIALELASRWPDRPARLVLVSAAARYVHSRSVAVFDRLGGPEAGEVAAQYFADPSEATFAEYLRVCLPLYTRQPVRADVIARMEFNQAAAIEWDRTAANEVDLREAAGRVRCPVLVLAGLDDPSFTAAGAKELAEALPPGLVRFELVEGAGYGVYRDRPDAIEHVIRFVGEDAVGRV
jgi:pimeloyl-ACP methyl ester carboxylesterase